MACFGGSKQMILPTPIPHPGRYKEPLEKNLHLNSPQKEYIQAKVLPHAEALEPRTITIIQYKWCRYVSKKL